MSLFKFTREDNILFWEWDDPSSRQNLISSAALSETEALLSLLETATAAPAMSALKKEAPLKAKSVGFGEKTAALKEAPLAATQKTKGESGGAKPSKKRNLPEIFEGIQALILISGKPDGFIAGADLKQLSALQTEEKILSLLEKAHSLLARLSALPLLKIAAIHGPCLGAGLELTLAFDIRLVSASRETRLGLPETRLGLIPGWGGCVRLPRLIGKSSALKMILGGRTVSSSEAQALRLADERAPPALLRQTAFRCAKDALAKGKDSKAGGAPRNESHCAGPHRGGPNLAGPHRGGPSLDSGRRRNRLASAASRSKSNQNAVSKQAGRIPSLKARLKNSLPAFWIFYVARKRLLKKAPLITAPFAALEAVRKAWRLLKRGREEEAFREESRIFAKQALQQESRQLRRLFFLTNQKKRAGADPVRASRAQNKPAVLSSAPSCATAKNESAGKRAGKRKGAEAGQNEAGGGESGRNKCYENLNNLGLIGAGTMGSAIARAVAAKNISVRLTDKSKQALSRALMQSDRFFKTERLLASRFFARAEGGSCFSPPSFASFPLIFPSVDLQGFENLDLVIEAATEDEETKNQLFQELAACIKSKQDRRRRFFKQEQGKARSGASTPFQRENSFEGPIVASNTSSLKIQNLASNWPWPSRFLGLHFFNPADKTPLVEVIKTDKLSPLVLESVLAWTRRINKIPLIVKDSPGFLVNRTAAPFLCETLWLLAEGLRPDFLDRLFSQKFGMKTGPFRLMDEIGLDIVSQAFNSLKRAGLPLDIPDECADLPSRLGKGRKEGRGFYLYDPSGSEQGIAFPPGADRQAVSTIRARAARQTELRRRAPLQTGFFQPLRDRAGASRVQNRAGAGLAQNMAAPFPLNPRTEELFSLSQATEDAGPHHGGAPRNGPHRGRKASDQEAEILDRGIFPLVNEGFKALEEEVVSSEDDVDWALVMGIGFPPWRGGPLTDGRERGLDFIGKKMQMWRQQYGARFRLSETLKAAEAARRAEARPCRVRGQGPGAAGRTNRPGRAGRTNRPGQTVK